MSEIEKALSLVAAGIVVVALTVLLAGENVLGATLFALGGALYVYATTPHDGDERIR